MPAGLDGNPDPIHTPVRDGVVDTVADAVLARWDATSVGVLRVAVDGIDGAGKSTFADELATRLRAAGVPIIRSTIDSFHRPRAERWQRGHGSAAGFYLDSHDLDAVVRLLLEPLSSSPARPFRVAAFDEPSDAALDVPEEMPPRGAVLVFDGIFLLRTELRPYWDISIFLDGWQRVNDRRIERAVAHCPSGPAGFVHLVWWWAVLERYVGGQRCYLAEAEPQHHADVVIDNNVLAAPRIVGRPRI